MGEIVSRGEWGTLGLGFPDAPKQIYADEAARIINEVTRLYDAIAALSGADVVTATAFARRPRWNPRLDDMNLRVEAIDYGSPFRLHLLGNRTVLEVLAGVAVGLPLDLLDLPVENAIAGASVPLMVRAAERAREHFRQRGDEDPVRPAEPPAGRVEGVEGVKVIDVLEERTITELPDGTRVDHLRYGAYRVIRDGLTGPVEVYPIQRPD
ncbi:hypothetical protein GCM10022199_27670 [Marihabitans asiaticum]|uniref:Uncharacterized protein n=1 Tax=Marihabitans asiaticum TaxID=415218 RepID=A0A560W608_9MICO|nr:hypothetical protein [Marihabitans asiaticum]TWD13064.1 hypothetical protein FB557_2831 [Marihabitans asiaticum]